MNTDQKQRVEKETSRRRTFAIISHPDAGKTTLTEKLLLYAGMIRTAGMVRGRKSNKQVSSDWMSMEQERGISITASAMQFNYKGSVINVLDTPGHQDFSEDTYRTLTAADSAVMVLDASKGVETQTRKLFAVCRMRGIPILTFINKMDLHGKDPFDLLSELEEVLGIQSAPINWPIGTGKEFRGVIERSTKEAYLFERSAPGGSEKVDFKKISLDKISDDIVPAELREQLSYELELLNEAGNPFTLDAFLKGEITPVFFGSALTNFGIEPFFDAFKDLAPCPGKRQATTIDKTDVTIDPVTEPFSAYVFKIQANMDPRHRDSMAYLRICSGEFERDMTIKHHRTNKELRLSRSHSMFGGDRTTLNAAYPGDIIGVVNPGSFAIGDSVSVRGGFNFLPMPTFPPEVVASIRPKDLMRRKAFDKGIEQFTQEGAVLILSPWGKVTTETMVAAVGKLQFEVLQHRLKNEYNVDTHLDILPYNYGAWLSGDPATFSPPSSSLLAQDAHGRFILLCRSEWEKQFAMEKNPNHSLSEYVDS